MTNLSWLPAFAQLAALLVAAQTLVSDSRRRRDLLALVLSAEALRAAEVRGSDPQGLATSCQATSCSAQPPWCSSPRSTAT